MSRSELHGVIDRHPNLSDRTRVLYRAAVERWVHFAGDDSGAWTPMLAQEFYNSLLGSMRARTANTVLDSLRSVTDTWAALSQEPRRAIFAPVITRSNEKPDQAHVLTHDEGRRVAVSRLGDRPRYMRDFAVIILGLQTGMRRKSFVGAHLEHLSFTQRTLEVPTKGKTELFTVPLSTAAVQALRPWVEWLHRQGLRSGPLFRSFHTPSIKTSTDVIRGPLTLRGMDEIVARLAREQSIPDFTPHSFRHTFVTWCQMANVPAWKIAAITGHALERSVGGTGGMIGDVYTRRPVAGAEAAEAIAQPWMFRPIR